jgi:hypothetical protein
MNPATFSNRSRIDAILERQMPRSLVRLSFLAALALLGVASAGFARAAVADLDSLANAQFLPSAAPALLGPVDPRGRNAWDCAPEAAAAAERPRAAHLPEPDGP